MTTEADNVIVGGGIYGCGTAWELARRGADVVLLEADTVASGASGGLGYRGVRANGRDPRELPLMARAYTLWPQLAERIDAPTGYERTGHLRLYEARDDAPRKGSESAPARQWLQEINGVDSEIIGADRLAEMEPAVADRIDGALFCPNDGVADHTAATRGLAEAADRAGATIREETTVMELLTDGSTVTAVRTEGGGRIDVGKELLLLANFGVAELLEDAFDLTLPIYRMLPQVMKTEPIDPMPVKHLIGHDSRTLALKEIPGNRVMISGGWRGEWDATAGQGRTLDEQVRRNAEQAGIVYPALADVAIEEADASRPESVTIDGIPIIDRLPDGSNTIAATGWCGHGFAISLAVNETLADWVTDGVKPSVFDPFGYDRFEN
ncbi:MAG: NAD(P)/FAD-dependent oxidoreductase [Halobacteriales archaeon]